MLITNKNILKYLDDSKVLLSERESIVKKKEKTLESAAEKLSIDEIIYYLFKSNIPNSAKLTISKVIDEDIKEEKKLEDLKNNFLTSNYCKEYILYKKYYPKVLKKIVLDKFYDKDISNLLSDRSLSISTKKIIVDLKLADMNIKEVLLDYKDIPEEIVNYIIDNRLTNLFDIYYCLRDSYVPIHLKQRILKKNISIDDLFSLLNKLESSSSMYDFVLNSKIDEINDFIDKLNYKNILKIIDNNSIPEKILDRIMELKKSEMIKAIKSIDSYSLKKIIGNTKNKKLLNLIFKSSKIRSHIILINLEDYEVLRWLNNPIFDDKTKEKIMTANRIEIAKAIKELSYNDAFYRYLSESSTMPQYVQDQIFNSKKNLLYYEINNSSEESIFSNIYYGSYQLRTKKVMIEQKINKANLVNALSKGEYCQEYEILNLIIDTKRKELQSILENLEDEKLFTLNILSIPVEIKNRIIEMNIDLITDRLSRLGESECYKYLSSFNALSSVKRVILKRFNISIEDTNTCIEILKTNDANLVLPNFNKILQFILDCNMDINVFIQYGSGSKKHSKWLNNVVNIINENKEQAFIKVKNYLFNNFYKEDVMKENRVSEITNFLEVIDNFSSNSALLLELAKNNKVLTKEEQTNIKFLFNIDDELKSEVLNIEEIVRFRLYLFEKYKTIIYNDYIDIDNLKNIYNELLFCKADKTLNDIGGTASLITLRLQNRDNQSMCELIDELLFYSNFIELVNDTNNKEGLQKSLKYIFEKKSDSIIRIQNMFYDFDKKVTRLYELDSQINLTPISKYRSNETLIDSEFSIKYNGTALNVSDKNYVLYAHVMSYGENIEDLINGKSSGDKNFISMSAISYLGQRYYYSNCNRILAYDRIPTGSFICSSINNMASNGSIDNNSSEVRAITRKQKGILETSSVTTGHSEILLYREGLKPCGIILVDGKAPTVEEQKIHEMYDLPYIITQNIATSIENPVKFFKPEEIKINMFDKDDLRELNNIIKFFKTNVSIHKKNDTYTGREIALITDSHSMFEPTIAVLEEIKKSGITEIYSLGDNVGLGPNPSELVDLLEAYNVQSIAGNSEYYNTLGIEPFNSYFDCEKTENQEWTSSELGTLRINKLKLYKPSIDITIGNKKIALCHFANDIRWDYGQNSTWNYQSVHANGGECTQFLYTNSDEAKRRIDNCIISHKKSDKSIGGYLSAKEEPLFEGKSVTDYDAIIQGHVHFDMQDTLKDTKIYTLRAVGMGYSGDDKNKACYYVLKERIDGTFDIEKRLVDFNKSRLISSIKTSSIPHKEKLYRFLNYNK